MSGETRSSISSWTTDTLKSLNDVQFKALREEQRAQKELLQAENAATAQALKIAREELERRLEGLNDLRKEVTRDREQFVKLDVYVPAHEQLRQQRIADNEKAIQLSGVVGGNSQEIAAMKSSLMWLTRLILGALILGVVGYVFQKLTGR